MERRVLLAVFLSFLVLVIYQRWVGPPAPPVDQIDGVQTGAPDQGAAASMPPRAGGVRDPAPAAPAAPPVATTPDSFEPLVADAGPRDIVVESDLVRAAFTSRGAELVSWQLKRYLDDTGGPVELVPPQVEAGQALPFALVVPGDPALTARLHDALFRPSADGLTLTADSATLTFEYEDTSGLHVRKTFTFNTSLDQPYVVEVGAAVTTAGGSLPVTIEWGPALGGVRATSSRLVFQQMPGALLYGRAFENDLLEDVDMHRAQPGDLAERSSFTGQFTFAGVDNHYFLVAALPGNGQARFDFRPVSTAALEHDLVAFNVTVEPAAGAVPVFMGPKDFDVLGAVHPDLVRAIDFGFLSVLVVPLHRTLKGINGYLDNYGWSIILLTVLINIVIFPLRHKSVVSMRKMQELQPEMKAIQARYANVKASDPGKQKMNQEVMELYRKHGANPASGCLPMLLTMPILFAFFRLLSMAIEIRGAPFIGWITDLSVHDPLYVTPLIMGGAMVFQQRMQPSGADPMQQKIMMLMPVVFTFMFLWAPSGLVIYWLTSNLIGIGQQVVTNRIAGPPRVHKVRPPAERQVRKPPAAPTIDVEPAQPGHSPPKAEPRAKRGRRSQSTKGGRRSRAAGRS